MKHIVHLIPSLAHGGAEQTLVRLIQNSNPKDVQHSIICFYDGGALYPQIQSKLVHYKVINLYYLWNLFILMYTLRKWRPHVLQTWMYMANVLGGIGGKVANISQIYWNIRTSQLEWKYNSLASILFCRIGAWLSRLPTKILCCSQKAIEVHIQKGYAASKFKYIPNGLQTDVFKPAPIRRKAIRKEWGLQEKDFVIGMVGRFHPQKDYLTFLKAAAMLAEKYSHVRFVIVGTGIDTSNNNLMDMISPMLKEKIVLKGAQLHLENIYPGFDLFTLASNVEAFPNVVAEAMACGIPAIASDVGDVGHVIGDTGWVVPRQDPQALVHAWEEALSTDLKEKGRRARARIEQEFSMEKMVNTYTQLYLKG